MRLGYIGLGAMGGGMAHNLLSAGFELFVNDARRETAVPLIDQGAVWCETPADVARQADVIFTSLPGPKVVEQVTYGPSGVAEAIRAGSIYVDMSTSSPFLIRKIHADFAERGVDVIDAAVSGLPPDARNGNLAIYVGGDRAVFERVESALKAMGPRSMLMGPIGSGMVTKIVHNWICFGAISVMMEGFTAGAKAGVDVQALYDAVAGGTYGRGEVIKIFPTAIFPGKFELAGSYGMPLSYARKDVGLAAELGRELGVPMHLCDLVEQDLIDSVEQGHGDDKATPFFVTQQEKRAGVELRIAKSD